LPEEVREAQVQNLAACPQNVLEYEEAKYSSQERSECIVITKRKELK